MKALERMPRGGKGSGEDAPKKKKKKKAGQ